MKNLTVAVSGINSVDNPGSGIGIIRSLKEANPDIRCIGLAYDAMDPGLYLDQYIDRGYLLPYPSASKEKYLDRLLYICEENEVDIIIPAFDSELPHYIQDLERLQEKNVRLIIPTRKQYEECSKPKLSKLAGELNIKVPLTVSVTSYEELNAALEQTGFPAVIKGRFYEASTVHSYYEAQAHFNELSMKWGFPVLVQQFIDGNDYNLVGLGGTGGEPLGTVPAKKLLLTQQGKIWTAVTIENPAMTELAEKFTRITGFTGGFELEFRMDKNEEIYLLEINPRFPAWVYLATAAGINLPYRYVLNLVEGRTKFSREYTVGKLLVRYTGELIRDISDFEKITVEGEKS